MEKGLFHELYGRLREVDFRSFPPDKQSGYLHGDLTVYAMVRVYPWLEADFGTPHEIHERAKDIAGTRCWFGRRISRRIPGPVTRLT